MMMVMIIVGVWCGVTVVVECVVGVWLVGVWVVGVEWVSDCGWSGSVGGSVEGLT